MPSGKSVHVRPFGLLNDTRETKLYTLRNQNGISASITDYGATLVSFQCPDRDNTLTDIVLGFDSLDGYLQSDAFLGATIGRHANRIAGAKFSVNGKDYPLAANNGPNNLHGGPEGFSSRLWHSDIIDTDQATVRFTLFSPDGDQGFPGNVTIHVTYCLRDDNALSIHVEATCDADTPLSITNHSYFNLAGKGPIDNHWLTINSDTYTPQDEYQIPTGEFANVEGTPFDFTEPHQIGERIKDDHPQLIIGAGYDHNYVTGAEKGAEPVKAAYVEHKESGRALSIYTNAPGIQLYTANFLDGSSNGKGVIHNRRHALCLEPQHIPDSPNNVLFPSCILKPGERYRHTMIFAPSITD